MTAPLLSRALRHNPWLHGHKICEAAPVQRYTFDLLRVQDLAELGAGRLSSQCVSGYLNGLSSSLDGESDIDVDSGIV